MNRSTEELGLTNSSLQFLSLQHELAMSVGLDHRLKPMLEQFSSACIRRLQLTGISYFMLQTKSYDESSRAQPTENIDFQHLLSLPDTCEYDPNTPYPSFPQRFFGDEGRFFSKSHPLSQQYTSYFNLSNLGFVALHKKGTPIDNETLSLLVPIIHRLSISCQSAIEHEQLLQAVAAKEKAEKVITHQLFHDELTGLANRRMLMKRLLKDTYLARKHSRFGAILYIDLDRFKSVNDTLGHSVGDQLLKTVAALLSSTVQEKDLVARLSGDEFAILLTDIEPPQNHEYTEVNRVIESTRKTFSKPVQAGEHILHITPSIGIETYPNSHSKLALSADKILRNADTAMYLAKSKGPNASAFYDKKMSSDLEKRLEVEKELHIAVKDLNQFELFYQPQYNSLGICVGAEALIRWSHPNQSLAAPGLFIPVAEETGLMLKLGKWVLIQACLHLRILEETGIPTGFTKLSVNVSAVQFNQNSFVEDLLSIVKKTAINPNYLTIELTESTLIENVNDTVEKMTELRHHGIDISIDDFGTGYSSLAYLNQYPITTLKIDQTFVKDLHLNSGNRAIVNAMIGLGENLNISVIAEGVESTDELDCLKEMDCLCYQGYHFCRPKPFSELVSMLSQPD